MIILSFLLGKRMFKYVYVPLVIAAIGIFACNSWVSNNAKAKCFESANSIPENDVGLVLGANKVARGGRNLFFAYRIDAAVELFKAGKIKHIIVSGDNHIKEYNEAEDMQQALIAKGIPDSCITLDFAGFRTLDSVVRCRKILVRKNLRSSVRNFIMSGHCSLLQRMILIV